MKMEVSALGERLVKVTLVGRLDTVAVRGIEARFVGALVPGAVNAVVDLSDVDFVASMGVRMLVTAARSLRLKGARMALYGVRAEVKRIFDTLSLGDMIAICATELDAIAAVAPPAPP